MNITFFRSSSFNQWSMCPQSFFLRYNLGLDDPSNLKAMKGTICHKALELLARQKLATQEGETQFRDDEVGRSWQISEFTPDMAADIAWEHYTQTKPTPFAWKQADFDDIRRLMWEAINWKDGMFSPLKRTVIWPERYFDITIEEPWAKYNFEMDNGEHLDGYLGLKGTIDLVCEVDGFPNAIELIDWKTGKRLDWATGQVKDWKKLRDDPQLRIYHYALSKIYPQADHITITIFWIADGGPYSLDFNKGDLPKTEQMLRERFETIRNCTRPKLKKSWKCTKLCHYGKTEFVEGSGKTKCQQIAEETVAIGIDKVMSKYSTGSAISSYGDGGGQSNRHETKTTN